MAQIEIKLKKSVIGSSKDQKATVQTLGLKRLNQTVTQPDNPAIRGMIQKVSHLVEVTETNN
jgi:large subunit ribosomal protein L30